MDYYKQISMAPLPAQGQSYQQTVAKRFQRICSSCAVWIKLFIVFALCPTDVVAEICVFERRRYNAFTSSYDSVPSTKECRWGCCDGNHSTPCCNAPIGLIVGTVFGAILILSLSIVVCCCCCLCKRRRQNATQQRRGTLRFSLDPRSSSNEVTQESGTIYRTDASGLPEYPGTTHYDPPPSYDEVMRGETNQAFKPETDTS